MGNSQGLHIALHAPNLMNVCVDSMNNEVVSGRLYHCYNEEGIAFKNMVQMLDVMESFYNDINYPQASTEVRSFVSNKQTNNSELKKVREQIDIVEYRGKRATFLVHVQYRQNSSWQGQLEWVEKGAVKTFNSELDLVKLIVGALEL